MTEKGAHLPLFISLLLKHLQFSVGFEAIHSAVEISSLLNKAIIYKI